MDNIRGHFSLAKHKAWHETKDSLPLCDWSQKLDGFPVDQQGRILTPEGEYKGYESSEYWEDPIND